jgi:hypothetical protein
MQHQQFAPAVLPKSVLLPTDLDFALLAFSV